MVVISTLQPASPRASGSGAEPEEAGPKEVSNGYSRWYTNGHTGHPNARLFITTPLTTAALDAPSARRTPNSWVRRAAANEVTPYNPTNVSAADTDRPANHHIRIAHDADDGPLLFDTAERKSSPEAVSRSKKPGGRSTVVSR